MVAWMVSWTAGWLVRRRTSHSSMSIIGVGRSVTHKWFGKKREFKNERIVFVAVC